MRRFVIAVAVALTAAPLSAQTEPAEEWPIGSRVRVWTAANRNVVGQLKEIRSDTLIIEMTGILTHEARIPASWAVRVEVSDGQRLSLANIGDGALGGAALGALTTLVLDEALGDLCGDGECEERRADYQLAIILGAALGAVAGATRLEDKWREVGLPGRITIAPSARAAIIGFSLRL